MRAAILRGCTQRLACNCDCSQRFMLRLTAMAWSKPLSLVCRNAIRLRVLKPKISVLSYLLVVFCLIWGAPNRPAARAGAASCGRARRISSAAHLVGSPALCRARSTSLPRTTNLMGVQNSSCPCCGSQQSSSARCIAKACAPKLGGPLVCSKSLSNETLRLATRSSRPGQLGERSLSPASVVSSSIRQILS